jgi:hypothetical protein
VGPGLERQEAALAARQAAAMRLGQLGPDSAAARGLELGMRLKVAEPEAGLGLQDQEAALVLERSAAALWLEQSAVDLGAALVLDLGVGQLATALEAALQLEQVAAGTEQA